MKALTTSSGQIGPFNSVTRTQANDGWLCDQCVYPDGVIGAATQAEFVKPATVYTSADRAALLKKIDVDTDAIYRAVQGDRAAEYALAEQEAIAFKAASYLGTAPSSVSSWAAAKGKTNTWAADDILTTAAQWRGAQASIRATRLAKKELARTEADIAPVEALWVGFVVAIKAALGVA